MGTHRLGRLDTLSLEDFNESLVIHLSEIKSILLILVGALGWIKLVSFFEMGVQSTVDETRTFFFSCALL